MGCSFNELVYRFKPNGPLELLTLTETDVKYVKVKVI